MTVLFFTLYLPVIAALFLIAFVTIKICDRLQGLEDWRHGVEDEETSWSGTIVWPDDWELDGLRVEAGDDDDTRRQMLENVIAITERRH